MSDQNTQDPDGGMPDGQQDGELTIEQAKALLLEQTKKIKDLNRENADRRKKLEAIEKDDDEKRKAAMTELERAKADLQSLTSERDALKAEKAAFALRQSFEKTARTLKLEFANETAMDDAFKALDTSVTGEDGSGMKDAIAALQKSRPYLFGKGAQQPRTDASNKGTTNPEITSADLAAQKRSKYGAL